MIAETGEADVSEQFECTNRVALGPSMPPGFERSVTSATHDFLGGQGSSQLIDQTGRAEPDPRAQLADVGLSEFGAEDLDSTHRRVEL